MDSITVEAEDGQDVDVLVWRPDRQTRGLVQIIAGMCEYAARYDDLATLLAGRGWTVIAVEQRGEGPRAAALGQLGRLPERGYQQLLDDIVLVAGRARGQHPGLPWVVLGHSMGSFLARLLAARRGDRMAGLALLGTGGTLGPAGRAGLALARTQAAALGPDHPSPLMNSLAFGPFNSAFRPARTDFDWLSRDRRQVDAYAADPLCGYVCSARFYLELLRLMEAANSLDAMRATPVGLPVGLFSGAEDPVGGAGRGVRRVARDLRDAGVREVGLTLYPGARHELLHEVNRRQVQADIVEWVCRLA